MSTLFLVNIFFLLKILFRGGRLKNIMENWSWRNTLLVGNNIDKTRNTYIM